MFCDDRGNACRQTSGKLVFPTARERSSSLHPRCLQLLCFRFLIGRAVSDGGRGLRMRPGTSMLREQWEVEIFTITHSDCHTRTNIFRFRHVETVSESDSFFTSGLTRKALFTVSSRRAVLVQSKWWHSYLRQLFRCSVAAGRPRAWTWPVMAVWHDC